MGILLVETIKLYIIAVYKPPATPFKWPQTLTQHKPTVINGDFNSQSYWLGHKVKYIADTMFVINYSPNTLFLFSLVQVANFANTFSINCCFLNKLLLASLYFNRKLMHLIPVTLNFS